MTLREPFRLFETAFAALWILALLRLVRIASRRARGAEFLMDPFPGCVGGAVSGRVEFRPGDAPLGEIEATLRCVNRLASLDHDIVTEMWSETRTIVVTGDSFIPIAFTTPATLPSSANPIGRYGIRWVLSIVAETQRGKFAAEFNLPVFAAALRRELRIA